MPTLQLDGSLVALDPAAGRLSKTLGCAWSDLNIDIIDFGSLSGIAFKDKYGAINLRAEGLTPFLERDVRVNQSGGIIS